MYHRLTEGMMCSYLRKGNPWDNVYTGAFYHTVRMHSHCDDE